MKVSEKILQLIENKGITKKRIYDIIAITRQGFDDKLKKQYFTTLELEKIAEELQVPISDFFEVDSEKNLLVGDNNFSKQKNSNNTTVSDAEGYKKEIEHLKKELLLKDKIIQLLENK